ncbi:MAG: signal recognition particle protein [Actinobacteria bacterium]|nr:signal recognition particle protein [Actinomycetota bacterium]
MTVRFNPAPLALDRGYSLPPSRRGLSRRSLNAGPDYPAPGLFESLTSHLGAVFDRLRSRGRLGEGDVDAALREVRLALLEADVNVAVTRAFLERVRARAVGAEVAASLTPGQQVVKIVHEELIVTLGGETAPLAPARVPPLRILMVGLQGSGKTTTAAKLARRLKASGKHPLLVAADLQRPAAVEQLEALGARAGVPVFTERSSTPPRLAKAALRRAGELGCDVVIVDTAGRLQIDEPLMAELAAVRRAVEPDEVLLVVDAMTGQDAVNVARGFLERTEITGLIFSKLDGDARGGAAISAREVTGRPIKFAGVGEGLDGLEVFHPERMASRLLGMGDVLTLIEKAEAAWDREQAEAAAEKMRRASFTLEDFLDQLQQVRRMGSLGQLLGMLPGAASAFRSVESSDEAMARAEAIIRSMTPAERRGPKLIDGSRRRRIAAGSGTSPQQVNELLRQFGESQRMMKAVAEGRSPIPGLALPGRRVKKKR